jgi:hypothetical protein
MTTPGLMATIRFDADLAGCGQLPAVLPPGIHVQGEPLRIDDLLRTDWRGVLAAQSGGRLRLAVPTSFGLAVIGSDSPRDLLACDGVVAAVVAGDGNAVVDCLNPRTDFVSEIPVPCETSVRLDRPLNLQKRPRHSITHVGANLVFAERFLDRLGWNTLGQSYHIHVKGRLAPGYCRWLPDATADRLTPLCRKECLCWRCGTPLDAPLDLATPEASRQSSCPWKRPSRSSGRLARGVTNWSQYSRPIRLLPARPRSLYGAWSRFATNRNVRTLVATYFAAQYPPRE